MMGGFKEQYERHFSANGQAAEKPVNPLLASRVLLRKPMEEGVEPPEELEPGILLKGKIHHIFGAAGLGKTMLAQHLAKNSIERGEKVVYFDDENGVRTFSERLQDMGVDPEEVDNYLFYVPFPSLPMSQEAQRNYQDLLGEIKPDLIIFDSWISFLAGADMNENENSDVQKWCTAYTQPARTQGITVVILDHVPHDGSRSRGASRKKDEADVQWQVHKVSHFDRDTVGEVKITLEKDREAWLDQKVTFSMGGTSDGRLLVKRSSGTVEEPSPTSGLTPSAHRLLDTLRDRYSLIGAKASEWANAAGVSRQSVYRFKGDLIGRGLVREEHKRYFPVLEPDPPRGSDVTHQTPGEDESVTSREGSNVTPESGLDKPHTPKVSQVSQKCNTVQNVTPAESVTECNNPQRGLHSVTPPVTDSATPAPPGSLSVGEVAKELRRHKTGPARALQHYLDDPNPKRLQYLTCAILVARNRDADGWEEHAPVVKEAAADPDNHPLACECEGCL